MAGSAYQPLRPVLDTNVLIAGLLWNGPPRRLIALAIDGELVELAHTLGYSKFAARIEGFGTSIAALIALIAQYAAVVSLIVPTSVLRVVAGDADDDHVIAAAVAARAELIATGDRKHLLPIGSHRGIAIVTARDVVERLDATGQSTAPVVE